MPCLLKTYSQDIRLVFVDGKPLYGDRKTMRDLVDRDELDEIVVSHKKRSLHLIKPGIGDLGEQHYNEMMDLLEEVLDDVAPLVEDEPGSRPGYPRSLN